MCKFIKCATLFFVLLQLLARSRKEPRAQRTREGESSGVRTMASKGKRASSVQEISVFVAIVFLVFNSSSAGVQVAPPSSSSAFCYFVRLLGIIPHLSSSASWQSFTITNPESPGSADSISLLVLSLSF